MKKPFGLFSIAKTFGKFYVYTVLVFTALYVLYEEPALGLAGVAFLGVLFIRKRFPIFWSNILYYYYRIAAGFFTVYYLLISYIIIGASFGLFPRDQLLATCAGGPSGVLFLYGLLLGGIIFGPILFLLNSYFLYIFSFREGEFEKWKSIFLYNFIAVIYIPILFNEWSCTPLGNWLTSLFA